ncbi:MAG: 2OG-Fe(II) oxygenase family protein [Chlamydiota bacterium]
MRNIFIITFTIFSFFTSLQGELQDLDFTIPVVDLHDFYNPKTKQAFVDKVAKAMHEVGFFAVIHPNIEEKTLLQAYRASQDFFSYTTQGKLEICDPSLNGQRGYVTSEVAQECKEKDFKEFIHIGRANNLWPSWMDLQNPLERLLFSLDEHGNALQKAFALAIGEEENYFTDMTAKGECLLRALHYPANPTQGPVWAAQHTDIDLFTILPMATEEGLQICHEGNWIDVKVPSDAFIINGGDKLQNLTNGYFKSSLHRVVAKPNTERYSIVYFVHPRDEDSMEPTAHCIEVTGGVQNYPKASSLELLACRLRELGLASQGLLQLEQASGILDRMKDLIDAGVAADPIQKTYFLWEKSLENQSNE